MVNPIATLNSTIRLRDAIKPCAVGLLAVLSGCSTLSTLGIPLAGPHQMMLAADQIRRAAGPPPNLPRELSKSVSGPYVVEPGDVLVVEPADFNSSIRIAGGDQVVKPDGSIDLGRFGSVAAAGKTLPELQAEVQAMVQASEENGDEILVRLISWESKVFYVLGEVNAPGAYPYSGRETVLDALVAAGELTDRANRHKIIFTRPSEPSDCRVVLPICYNQIVQLGDTSSNYQLLPGDRVYVTSLTLWDDVLQTLFPGHFEHCTRCDAEHDPCFVGNCEDGECTSCSVRSRPHTPPPLKNSKR